MCAAVQEQSPNVVGIRSWAKQLASENRDLGWVIHGYVWPESVKRALKKLEVEQSGLMGLVGLQGVGKSSALQALTFESLKAKPYNSQDFSSRVAYFKAAFSYHVPQPVGWASRTIKRIPVGV